MRQTPLYDEHVSLGGKVVDFHGWALPVQFSGIVMEHLHTRTKAALFDCSHMGEFRIHGQDAVRAYSRLVCSDPERLPVGRGRYGAVLNDEGGIIDDVITIRLAEDEWYAVTNAGPLEKVSPLFRGAHSGIEDVSDTTAKIDIQGPSAREVLVREIPEAANLKYFNARPARWKNIDIILSRTGYTGELGYELFVPEACAPALWRALLEHAEVEPAGLGARDTLRTEVGYLLSGQDFDESRTPLEANMESFVAWDTDFTGKEALLEQRSRGGYAVMTAIRTEDRRAPRHDFDVKLNGAVVGCVTSGTYGPSVGHGIGLAYVPQDLATPGHALTAGPKELPIETTSLPFYTAGTCRK
ncbi:MAG: glycine cleavage system aminomethyltransferase GcvT [Candidatus Hydrogenedentes bacterium]|nr:glycine cleavage system aminomethyltransferase GcvT [Candidatus Hydrogenedentota bacterium]